jgi:hypothetical protein
MIGAATRSPRRGFVWALGASLTLHACTLLLAPARIGGQAAEPVSPSLIEVRLAPAPALPAPGEARPVAIAAPQAPRPRRTSPAVQPAPAQASAAPAATVATPLPDPQAALPSSGTGDAEGPASGLATQVASGPVTPPAASGAAPSAVPSPPGAATTAAPAEPPPGTIRFPRSGRLEYAVTIGTPPTPVGRATYVWEASERMYRLSLTAQTTGLVGLLRRVRIEQVSRGRITPEGLRPDEFRFDRGPNARNEAARFDWSAGRITYGYPDAQQTGELKPGTQDVLSLILQFAFVPITQGSRDVLLTTGRKLYVQSYQLVAEDLIETPGGAFRAWHLRRVRTQADDDGYDMWLASDRPFLPIRIRWTDRDGRITDATVDTIRLAQD